jgi:hypothetical protein
MTDPLITLAVAAHKKKYQMIFIDYGQQPVCLHKIVLEAVLDSRFTESGTPGRLFRPSYFTGKPLPNDGFCVLGRAF